MNEFNTVSIVVPVYNEGRFIKEVVREVAAADVGGMEKEIIVVNDGSADNTKAILEEIAVKMSSVKVFEFLKNKGKGAAVKKGIMESKGDIVIIQDADLEYRPSDYPLLLQPIKNGEADVVYGSRFLTQEAHRVLFFWHAVANRLLTLLSNALTNLNLTDVETGYKVFKGDLIRGIAGRLTAEGFGFELEVTARLSRVKNIRIYEVGISYHGRTYWEGKKIRWPDGVKALWEIIKYNLFVK